MQKKWREEKEAKNKWKEKGFEEEEVKEWMVIGLKIDEYELANCLKNEKNYTPQEAKNNLTTELRKECELILAAKKSKTKINKFIEEANLEKIPYQQLTNIKYLAKGGFGKIYRAEWEDKNIILKSLNQSQEITSEFLREIASHKLFADDSKIVKCHGVSQDPEGNYIMIMDYVRGGDLRKYLKNNYPKLDFKKKIIQLHSIAEGLKVVHQKGLIHKDFHSGNILSAGSESFFADLKCHITDLGLCRPASEKNEGNIYGVMPYVAPEVLSGNTYTRKSDVYSFGMVAYEILVGHPPYANRAYDGGLALKICSGFRPKFKIKTPWLLEDLIKKCWDDNPSIRPEASEAEETLSNLVKEVNNPSSDIYQQCQEAEEYNKTLPEEIRNGIYKLHPGATTHSKLINTKQITQKLAEYASRPVEDIEILSDEENEVEKDNSLEEINKEKAEIKVQLEIERDNLQKLQTKIQQLETRLNELEQQQQLQTSIQLPPKSPTNS